MVSDRGEQTKVYAKAQPLQPSDNTETIFWLMNQPAAINIDSLEVMPVTQAWNNFTIERGGVA